ncbi:poly-gamma-glutamate synthase PgsB [candidate division WOR-3 bacterium]|nr:poly-gamma-glutamate synthase PgsB [candidate division WOR-3 bacterium]
MLTLYGIYTVSIILLVFIAIYWLERFQHEKRVRTVPLRIWVNGSRGKSSVTRLIAAGLRVHGQPIIAKTTGTMPRLIIDNDTEEAIVRLGMANIREQVKIFKQAVDLNAQAIVFECMALRPDLQNIESHRIVQPNIVVITNVRPDHLDVMGPGLMDVRKAYLNSLPSHCMVYTTDAVLAEQCSRRPGIECTLVDPSSLTTSTKKTIHRFTYIEHEENIALALSVCRHYGIETSDALHNMALANPDPGALRQYDLTFDAKHISLIYAMAANDPESTRIIWDKVDKSHRKHIHVLVNCRKDRLDRTLQFIEILREFGKNAVSIILTGEATGVLSKRLKKYINKDRILDIGNKSVDQASGLILSHVHNDSLVFAMGNTVGYGMELIRMIVTKGSPPC